MGRALDAGQPMATTTKYLGVLDRGVWLGVGDIMVGTATWWALAQLAVNEWLVGGDAVLSVAKSIMSLMLRSRKSWWSGVGSKCQCTARLKQWDGRGRLRRLINR